MSKNKFSLKQAISPIVSILLLISITVIISLGTYNFLIDYVQDTQRTVENNAILDSLQIRSIFTDSDQSIIQTPFEQINISKVIYEGVECTNNSGVVSGKPLRVNMSSCAQASGQSSGTLTIESNEGVIQQNIQIDSFSGSTSGSETEGGSPSFSSCTLDGETVSHGNNGTFYNSSSVAFGNSCSSIVRTCDDGTLDGDSSYNYSSCSVDGQDTDPDAFSFTNQTDVATSSSITSNSLTPTGYDGPLSVSVNGDGSPQISINGGSWTTSTSMSPGDSIEVRLTSSSSYDTTSQATVDLGDYSTTWSVTTEESSVVFDPSCAFKDDKTGCESYYLTDTVDGINVVHDTILGLYWEQSPSTTERSWSDSQTHCSNLGSGWRLPTLVELEASLVDVGRASDPYIVGGSGGSNLFDNVQSSNYWTDTRSSSSFAYSVHFYHGYSSALYVTNSHYALCVKTAS
ncbi:MAG: DUF1566 domain-containing protein [Candidatus Nanoarchaeia archaeon]